MLSKLQKELDQLNEKQQKTQSCINNLFFSVEEIYLRQIRINHPILPNPNLIIKLRPEIINFIFAFLDYSSFLQFRLVSQNTNNLILYLLSLKLNKIQQQQNIKQLELNEIIENHPELGEQTESLLLQYQLSLDDLKKIRRQDICELCSYSRPPPIIERVLNLLTILLTQNYVEQQDKWRQSLKLVIGFEFFNQLLNFDTLSITDDKLKLLQQITTMEERFIYSSSVFAYYIFKYIRTVVMLRQEPQYKIIFQIGLMRQDVAKLQQSIDKLQKILGQI
ncbi:unnamed protein product [Paramecium pentaurelia]|uniref:F-box domain-containing protein n=1 Tax=Paramecium pentaurelia TaxID=43138 RepID=A0A8S1V0L4_9CILI|nr:unnamed protein product [Paramecium pentaurelia]